jgi:two-component system nitrogen regulation sensor histidine kinase NtrY
MQQDLIRRRKRKWLIAIGILLLIVVLTAIETLVHELRTPSNINDNLRVFTLLNFNIIVVMGLLLLVFRQLIKLYQERKQNVLGTKFKAKLVFAFVGLSLVPTILLFLVSSNLISNTIDSWFNTQNEESLKKSLVVAQTYYENSLGKAFRAANEISQFITHHSLLDAENLESLNTLIQEKQIEAQLGAVKIITAGGENLLHMTNPRIPYSRFIAPNQELVERGLKGEEFSIIRRVEDKDLIDGVVPIFSKWMRSDVVGVLLFNYYEPHSLMDEINDIRQAYEEYTQRKVYRTPLKSIYTTIVLVATLIILFSAIWIGFQIARGITIPFQKLAEGTRAVAAGNLDYKVEVKADDEIKILVNSFNQMTTDLRHNKVELEKVNLNLKNANLELEQRTHYIETVLQNIATGVVSIDRQGYISTLNKSAVKMLGLKPQEAKGRHFEQVFGASGLEGINHLIKGIQRSGLEKYRREIRLKNQHSVITLLAWATVLRDSNQGYLGIVLVLDDLTQLIKAQKVAAWQEVARRIAHEIKNPLTPIQLCSQRLRRKLNQKAPEYSPLVNECTNTIIREVDELKALVDEFSRFARMPPANLQPNDIGKVIEDTVSLYTELPDGSRITTNLAPDMPTINIDSEQIKRVLINLIDNALHAANGKQEISISTKYEPGLQIARLEVADQGVGISDEDKEKLFMPYFSTKKSGTGLGLAIVQRIITDHHGYIRAEDNESRGTKFIIDLPVGV